MAADERIVVRLCADSDCEAAVDLLRQVSGQLGEILDRLPEPRPAVDAGDGDAVRVTGD